MRILSGAILLLAWLFSGLLLSCDEETTPEEVVQDSNLLSDDEIDLDLLEDCQSYCRRLGVCWDGVSKDEVIQCVDDCEYLLRTAHSRAIDEDLLACNDEATCDAFSLCIKTASLDNLPEDGDSEEETDEENDDPSPFTDDDDDSNNEDI